MFDHKNFALNGLFPGLVSTRSVANLGHFEIEVIIEPVPSGGGGGGFYQPQKQVITKYKVKIRITRKGKVWAYEKIVGTTTAKVIAKLLKKKVEIPIVSVSNTSMVEQTEPQIKVTVNVNSNSKT